MATSFVDRLLGNTEPDNKIKLTEADGYDYADIHTLDNLLSDVTTALEQHDKRIAETLQKEQSSISAAYVQEPDHEKLKSALTSLGQDTAPLDAEREAYAEVKRLEQELSAIEEELSSLSRQRELDVRYTQVLAAVDAADKLAETLADLDALRSQLPGGTLEPQYAALREAAARMWTESIFISDERVSIAPDNSDKLSEAVAVLEATGTLGDQVKALCGYIDKGVLPRVLKGGALLQSDAVVLGSGNVGLDGLRTLLTYVTDRLPDATRVYLHRYFSAPLARHLTETYLPSQLPLELQSGSRLQRLLEQVRSTEAFLGELGLLHDSDLRDFSTNLPNVWLIKYRDTHLADLRQRMLGWLGETEAVTLEEHVSGADLMQESGELQRAPQKNLAESAAVKPQTPSDEDAWNDDAWDVQDEQETDLAEAKKNVGVDANADEDAWGWGDEDDGGDIGNQTTQGPPTLSTTSTDQITLVDRFTVSTLPKCVLETITRVAADGDQLLTKYAGSPVAPAAAHFSEVIDTLVSLYLASVPHLQRTIGYPRMLTYNDCKWLSSKMAKIAEEVSSSVKEFGEHVYMVEIDERREALLAILAKAEGFVACTSPQQRETCDRVLQEVLDAIDRLHERWAVQLGQTTLLTALGTLCEACIASFTADVMSMTDISEQESTALAQLGDRLASVDKLFVSPASSPGEEPVALPAAWIPSWFRFRYVLDILEANLADITSFYHDGHLSDFAPHELADLVRALFADSDKRKKLLSELGS